MRLLVRGGAIVIWSLILAGVVQLVRRTIVEEDDEPDEKPVPTARTSHGRWC